MIYVALGANLPSRFGEPVQTLTRALKDMTDHGIHVMARSRLWGTTPVPPDPAQPDFINAVVAVQTSLSPEDLMGVLLSIEKKCGRVRSVPNAARLLDLDLIAYHDLQMITPLVTLPHPRLSDRAFVLKPLADIAPDWCHPVTGESLSVLISRLPPEQMAVPLGHGWRDD